MEFFDGLTIMDMKIKNECKHSQEMPYHYKDFVS